jgi:hypothetical protein
MAEGSGTRFVRRRMLTICAGMALLGVFGGFDDWMRARDDRAFDLRGKPAQSLPETHPSASTTAGDEVALSYVGPGDRVVNAKPIRLDATRRDSARGARVAGSISSTCPTARRSCACPAGSRGCRSRCGPGRWWGWRASSASPCSGADVVDRVDARGRALARRGRA